MNKRKLLEAKLRRLDFYMQVMDDEPDFLKEVIIEKEIVENELKSLDK